MTDLQLQRRAGKNYPDYQLYHRYAEKVQKLSVKSVVLIENPDDLALLIKSFCNGATIVNRTLSDVDVELYFEDSDGNRVLADNNSIPSGFDGNLLPDLVYLNKGEKIVLDVTSAASILTGEGLWCVTTTNNPPAPHGSPADRKHTRVTNTTFELTARPGIVYNGLDGYQLSVVNFSDDDLTVDIVASTPEGDVTLQPAQPVSNKTVSFFTAPQFNPSEDVTVKLVFSALPSSKYLLVCEEYLLTFNRFDLSEV